MNPLQTVAVYAGIGVGGIVLLSLCVALLRRQPIGLGGSFLAALAVVLMGLPFWVSAQISVGKNGLEAKFNTLAEQVDAVATASKAVTGEVQGLVAATAANQRALSAVAESVQHSQPLAPTVLHDIQAITGKPAASISALESAQVQFSAVSPALKALKGKVEINKAALEKVK
jgi:hypothetical protein